MKPYRMGKTETEANTQRDMEVHAERVGAAGEGEKREVMRMRIRKVWISP